MFRPARECLAPRLGQAEPDLYDRQRICIFACAFFLVCLFFAISSARMGLSVYSPDSWAYYELSHTVFEGDFYSFNTYRSYFSRNYSAAFPLGYPVLLAVLQWFVGKTPWVALVLNAVVAVVTWVVILQLSRVLRFSCLAGLALASSLVLFPPYLFEVFSGSSIPISVLFFLFALQACLSSRPFFSGLFLGGAALFRFDYLVYALLLQVAIAGLSRKSGRKLFLMPAGFVLGIFPWLYYSQTHFGKLWVSDNSWVALSAYRAYVLDFPVRAGVSALDQPLLWGRRVLGNLLPLWRSLSSSALRFPLSFMLPVAVLCCWRCLPKSLWLKSLAFLALLLASIAPYLLTGYFDQRYFSLFLLCVAAAMLFLIESAPRSAGVDSIYKAITFVALVCAILFAGDYMAQQSMLASTRQNKMEQAALLIERLGACHAQEPGLTYVFKDEYTMLAPQYGALTGYRAAFIPSNFDRLGEEERARYFAFLGPYLLVDGSLEKNQCPHAHWKTR